MGPAATYASLARKGEMASALIKNLPLGLLALTTIVHADLLDTENKLLKRYGKPVAIEEPKEKEAPSYSLIGLEKRTYNSSSWLGSETKNGGTGFLLAKLFINPYTVRTSSQRHGRNRKLAKTGLFCRDMATVNVGPP
jgi:hypothetical protein